MRSEDPQGSRNCHQGSFIRPNVELNSNNEKRTKESDSEDRSEKRRRGGEGGEEEETGRMESGGGGRGHGEIGGEEWPDVDIRTEQHITQSIFI